MVPTNDHISEATEDSSVKVLSRKEKFRLWFKRLGWAAFWFFVIKGTITTLIILFFGKKAWDALFQ